MRGIRESIRDGLRIIGIMLMVLCAVSFLLGCSTHKKTIESDTTTITATDTTSEHSAYKRDTTHFAASVIDTSWVSQFGHIIIYDTSLPVDTHTGKPPIKAEIDYHRDTHKGISQQTDNSTATEFTESERTERRDSTYEKTIYKEVSVKYVPWYARLRFILAITIISFLLGGFTAWRYGSKR